MIGFIQVLTNYVKDHSNKVQLGTVIFYLFFLCKVVLKLEKFYFFDYLTIQMPRGTTMSRQAQRGRLVGKYRRTQRQAQYSKYRARSTKRAYGNKAVVRMGDGFPKMTKMKLHYVDNFHKTGVAGLLNTYQFRLNSLYDFDLTGTGHQPYYFDQMMAVYDHYTVIGTKVTVTWTNNTANPVVVGGYLNDDGTVTPGTLSNCQEAPQSQYLTLPGTSTIEHYITHKWSATKWFTKNASALMADINLTGTASSDPGEATVLTLYYQALDPSNSTDVSFTVRAEFISIFSELKDIASS